ncbi:FAD-binding protein [Modestobacter sp. VKM Ac-2979]|uniref:FAD-binding and (Fe-S)-binding domain-containing protein n=1 Tax=unclassified Modestobacter TaxID=2643866 RepID=UPI0022ABC146|nr:MULTISPECIES: FAD-binding and (Fe-S)-binding domain-containing protein [unclassified Modestobacter]MCZ2811318.1 FAD-binding protein [Modestobacter sp. VKM Ac-2979]MCZ2840831.1 FAD-binding protein [Modestobacter sp. VKM Ac-2980]
MTAAPERPRVGVADLEQELTRALDGEVAFDDYTRHLFSQDASMYTMTPVGVAYPAHTADVVAAVRLAREAGIPVLARGAGTSLAGQTVGPGLVLDLSRHMHRITELDPEARTARVEPGVVQDDLNRAAAAAGLMFGPDTSTSNRATIGGMIGNNSAGSGSVRFGMTIDHVEEVDVVLADGSTATFGVVDEAERARRAQGDTLEAEIYRRLPELVAENAEAIATGFPSFWRRAGGYRLDRLAEGQPFDLAKFLVGSEGTLAIITAARVGLVPKPSKQVFAVGHFETVQAAINATEDALTVDPAQVELLDRTILDLSRQKIEYAGLGKILQGDPDALLFVSFTGDDEAQLVESMDRLVELWERNGHGYHTLRAVTPAQQGALLKVRKSALGLLMANSVGARRPLAFIEDTAVDPKHLAEYTARFKDVLDRHELEAGFYGHCSVGCLHIRPFVDLSQPGQVEVMRSVAVEIKDLVREYGGVNSSEHGDGLARSEFNRELFGDDLYEAMRQVKGLFDAQGTLNPGKIVDSPAMTEHLRDANPPTPGPLRTRLQFDVVGGMFGAADRCMNIGLCRKSTTGAMCPSYIATRMEEHSTRGRAGALVKALSEGDPHTALADERLHEVLDLCLMCKACKSECPLGVDVSAMKSEALAAKHDVHGTPLRSRAFGAIRTLNRLGSATAPLSNLPLKIKPLRALMDSRLGIARQRDLPVFHRTTLMRWFKRHEAPAALTQQPVTMLADSFTSYTEPGIGQAVVRLLEAAGHPVRLESKGCCGRASISKGLLDDARGKAQKLAANLCEGSEPGSPIVGCEPSCILTLRAEHVELLPDDPNVRDVAARVKLPEELLVEAIDDGRLQLRADSWLAGRTVVFHGHCHQKAEAGTAATVALLSRIPGVTVQELDAGCCGMAGSFGFESEHYDVSLQVGEDRLFPAVRAAAPDAVIAATGVSCRQQIFHGTQRTAWHPAELVLEALQVSA